MISSHWTKQIIQMEPSVIAHLEVITDYFECISFLFRHHTYTSLSKLIRSRVFASCKFFGWTITMLNCHIKFVQFKDFFQAQDVFQCCHGFLSKFKLSCLFIAISQIFIENCSHQRQIHNETLLNTSRIHIKLRLFSQKIKSILL